MVPFLTIPFILFFAWAHFVFRRRVMYSHTRVAECQNIGLQSTHPHKKIIYCLRFLSLITLALLVGKPQLVDQRSSIRVEGIDIVLVLDVSGSMEFRDYSDDNRTRLEVARAEAKHFIAKRDNDAIGLVVFGNDAVSRAPLTVDKKILKTMIDTLKIGLIDPSGTCLFTGILTAANRLKNSKARSKVMILLTDGEPSKGDADPVTTLDIVKKIGIKIYTIGIGSEEEQYIVHPWYGTILKPRINKELLTMIARETGGQFFNAKNAVDMRSVYNVIDQLEKTEYETNLFSCYYDLFVLLGWCVLFFLMIEVVLSSLVWFRL